MRQQTTGWLSRQEAPQPRVQQYSPESVKTSTARSQATIATHCLRTCFEDRPVVHLGVLQLWKHLQEHTACRSRTGGCAMSVCLHLLLLS